MPTPQKVPVDHEVVNTRLLATLDDLQKQRDAIIRGFPTYQEGKMTCPTFMASMKLHISCIQHPEANKPHLCQTA